MGRADLGPLLLPADVVTSPKFKLKQSPPEMLTSPKAARSFHGFIQLRHQEEGCAGRPRAHPRCWQPGWGYVTQTEVENTSRIWHLLQDGSRFTALLKGGMIILKYQV